MKCLPSRNSAVSLWKPLCLRYRRYCKPCQNPTRSAAICSDPLDKHPLRAFLGSQGQGLFSTEPGMAGPSPKTIEVALGAIKDIKGIDEKQKRAVYDTIQFASNLCLTTHTSLEDGLEEGSQNGDNGFVEAFTGQARISVTAQRERLLRKLSEQQQQHNSLSGSLAGLRTNSCEAGMKLSCCDDPRVAELLAQKLCSWSFDVFMLAKLTKGRPLEAVTLAGLERLGLIEDLQLPIDVLRRYIRAIEARYCSDNPYHNATHAADVVQTLVCFIVVDGFQEKLLPLEVLALVLAAVIHDVGHPGLSNEFLINTEDELAIRYSDISVNEHAHLALAWELLLQPQHNFLAHMNREDRSFVRGLVIDLVLATDMKVHAEHLQELTSTVQLFGRDVSSWNVVGRTSAMSLLLHAADISNTTKPFSLSLLWALRVNQEFWLEGEKEQELGLPSLPLHNRASANIPQSQIWFSNKMVRPCYEALALIAPVSARQAIECLDANLVRWAEEEKKGVKVPVAE